MPGTTCRKRRRQQQFSSAVACKRARISLLDLPAELLHSICSLCVCSLQDVCVLRSVCRYFQQWVRHNVRVHLRYMHSMTTLTLALRLRAAVREVVASFDFATDSPSRKVLETLNVVKGGDRAYCTRAVTGFRHSIVHGHIHKLRIWSDWLCGSSILRYSSPSVRHLQWIDIRQSYSDPDSRLPWETLLSHLHGVPRVTLRRPDITSVTALEPLAQARRVDIHYPAFPLDFSVAQAMQSLAPLANVPVVEIRGGALEPDQGNRALAALTGVQQLKLQLQSIQFSFTAFTHLRKLRLRMPDLSCSSELLTAINRIPSVTLENCRCLPEDLSPLKRGRLHHLTLRGSICVASLETLVAGSIQHVTIDRCEHITDVCSLAAVSRVTLRGPSLVHDVDSLRSVQRLKIESMERVFFVDTLGSVPHLTLSHLPNLRSLNGLAQPEQSTLCLWNLPAVRMGPSFEQLTERKKLSLLGLPKLYPEKCGSWSWSRQVAAGSPISVVRTDYWGKREERATPVVSVI